MSICGPLGGSGAGPILGPKLCEITLWANKGLGSGLQERIGGSRITLEEGIEAGAILNAGRANESVSGPVIRRDNLTDRYQQSDLVYEQLLLPPRYFSNNITGLVAQVVITATNTVIDRGFVRLGRQSWQGASTIHLSTGVDKFDDIDTRGRGGVYHVGVSFGISLTAHYYILSPRNIDNPQDVTKASLADRKIEVYQTTR